jgi:acyl-CoA synthetase (AMP-forming)/AMP-acid ligase II
MSGSPRALTGGRTLGRVLREAVAAQPDKSAVIWGERMLTYEALAARARAVAANLRAAGLGIGDRCAIWLPNTGEFVELYFGAALAGVIAVPVNFRFTAREARYLLSDCEPAAVVIAADYLDMLAATGWRDRFPAAAVIVVGEATGRDHFEYEQWLRTADINPRPPAQTDSGTGLDDDIDRPFFIGYTSGTTGAPKGAVVRQSALLDNIGIIEDEYGQLRGSDRFLTLMPLFHSNSTWFAVACVRTGATNVITESGKLSGERILDAVDRHQITVTSVVPTILHLMLDARRSRSPESCRSLRGLLCGSAPVTPLVKQRVMSEFAADLWEGYGATETGVVTSLAPTDQLDHLRSVGRAVAGKQIELRDEYGHRVPAGEVGELWCKGRGILLDYYWRNDAATAQARDHHGWYSVGDLARESEDGYFHLVDRKNDLIITGGENVYPAEVEETLLMHASVREAAVVGVPDDRWGERVLAVVVLADGAHADADAILAAARASLARYKVPDRIEFWPDLPKTPTGKIQRRRIRELVAAACHDTTERERQ